MFNAATTISSSRASTDGKRVTLLLVNYATAPAQSVSVWVEGQYGSGRLEAPGEAPVDLPVRRRSGRTEITISSLKMFGAVLLR